MELPNGTVTVLTVAHGLFGDGQGWSVGVESVPQTSS